jgi:hypothetical protein
MQNINCRSLIDSQDADFRQIHALVESIKESLNAFKTNQGLIKFQAFEISQQMITPIQNLDDLFTALFKETESEVNEEQRKYLTICERALAAFYCHIQHFLELHDAEIRSPSISSTSELAKEWAHEFYFNAMYELRTPYFILKGYSQTQPLGVDSDKWRTFVSRIYSSPFVPEHQAKVDGISYWIDELGKFIDALPRLWHAAREEDAA